MNNRMRIGAVVVALAAGATGAGLLMSGGDGPKTVTSAGRVEESAADVIVDGGETKTTPDRADITMASAEYRPDGLAFMVQVRQPVDPLVDSSWVLDNAFISWEVDTTGDGAEDFEISYHTAPGEIVGEVTKVDAAEDETVACKITAGQYDAATGYTAVVDPACLGNPKAVAYRVSYFYQADALNDDSPTLSDTAPDEGMTKPLAAPQG